MKPTLRAVEVNPAKQALIDKSAAEGVHIADLIRADIRKRDWSRTHIAGDRRDPLYIADAPKRTWASWSK